jgi:WD40 repeat protein
VNGRRWAALIAVALVAIAIVTFAVIPDSGGDVSVASLTNRPFLLFRSTTLDKDYGTLEVTSPSDPGAQRALTSLKCARVAYAGGRGVCVTGGTGGLYRSPQALVFDASFTRLFSIPLQGYPSRAAVSRDGHYGATTNFVGADSYATSGFSTRTYIIDLRTGRIMFDLEKLQVTRDGSPFENANFNFWGVTFAPDNHHFYATLGSGAETYLIEGDVTTETATVLRTGVECPSLSPDGKEIAFKQRNPGTLATWRLSVLNLSTMQAHPLAETRNVDDQAAWLNNTTVAYGLAEGSGGSTGNTAGLSAMSAGASIATDTWTVPADGSGHPTLLLKGSWSLVPAQ